MTARKKDEGGSILVLTLLVTLVILAVGLTAMWISSSGMKMSGNLTRRQEALYAAEAGMEHARSVLANTPIWDNLLNGCGSSLDDATTGGRGYVLCEGTIPLANYLIGTGTSKTAAKVRGVSNIQYTVFVRNDAAEAANPAIGLWNDSDERIVVRAEGTGRDGLSFFAIEAIMSKASSLPEEDNYSQLGGSAQNQNSARGKMPIP